MKNYCEHMKTVAHIKGAKHVINYNTITSMKGLIFITVFTGRQIAFCVYILVKALH